MKELRSKPLSFQSIRLTVVPEQLSEGDPLGRWFHKLSLAGLGLGRIVLFAWGVYVVALMGTGVIASGLLASQPSKHALTLFDQEELFIAIWVYLIQNPIAWLFYTWQQREIARVFDSLHQNGVVGQPLGKNLSPNIFDFVTALFNRRHIYIAILIYAILGTWWWDSTHVLGSPFYFGRNMLWYEVNPLYNFVWMLLASVLPLYMLGWIVVRQIIATRAFNLLFSVVEIRPQLYHPDSRNGLAYLGRFVLWSGAMSIFYILILSLMITYPLLFSNPPNLPSNVIALFISLLVVPPLVFLPLYEAHRVIARVRNRHLGAVAMEIRPQFSETGTKHVMASKDLLQELERRYENLNREYHLWPVQALGVTGVGMVTVVTLVLQAITLFK